jgi:hypothetical protein
MYTSWSEWVQPAWTINVKKRFKIYVNKMLHLTFRCIILHVRRNSYESSTHHWKKKCSIQSLVTESQPVWKFLGNFAIGPTKNHGICYGIHRKYHNCRVSSSKIFQFFPIKEFYLFVIIISSNSLAVRSYLPLFWKNFFLLWGYQLIISIMYFKMQLFNNITHLTQLHTNSSKCLEN